MRVCVRAGAGGVLLGEHRGRAWGRRRQQATRVYGETFTRVRPALVQFSDEMYYM